MKKIIAFSVLLITSPLRADFIGLGVASDYSGFFFGDVSNAADVEGRLAVGGNLTVGFDVGYRNPFASTLPTVVVQGNIDIQKGTFYNGPKTNIDTNASIGPSSASWLPSGVNYGDVLYGGSLNAHSHSQANFIHFPDYIDFAKAYYHVNALSSLLTSYSSASVEVKWSQVFLTGDNESDLQIFDVGNLSNISNLVFSNIKPGATIVINGNASHITLRGGHGGDQAIGTDFQSTYRDKILFNFSNAETLSVNTFVNGSILAPNANVSGTGHLEGTIIAKSLTSGNLELGYEPFKGELPSIPGMIADVPVYFSATSFFLFCFCVR